jgi:hypothetical protein
MFRTGLNFRFGREHRTFLSVNEFHYLTRSGPSPEVRFLFLAAEAG